MLSVQHLSKRFGRRKALDDISFEIEQGCYGLLGPNGAGKTTLIRCILGLYPVRKGTVKASKEKMGYLPQRFGVFKELKVKDVLAYFASVKKIPRKEQEREINRVLELVNLQDRKNDRVGKLSGGMQRRIGIAQAILGDPEILIFDEPTAGLDPEERARFKKMLNRIREGKIIIVSTHIIDDVENLCDHVLIMKEGKLLESVSVEEACEFAKEQEDGEGGLEAGFLQRIQQEK